MFDKSKTALEEAFRVVIELSNSKTSDMPP